MSRTYRRSFALALSLLPCFACGDAPRPVSPGAQQGKPAPSSELPAGHPQLGELPAGHPPASGAPAQRPALTDPSQFAGRVVFTGELANASTGRVIVSLREKGMKMPLWAYVVDLGDPEAQKQGLQPAVDGVRELIFVLNKDTTIIPSPLPKNAQLEVEARLDLDGSVDTREDAYFGTADAKAGDEGLRIELVKSSEKR